MLKLLDDFSFYPYDVLASIKALHDLEERTNQVTKIYYFAANKYIGCSHRHVSMKAAIKCALSINKRMPNEPIFSDDAPYDVYRWHLLGGTHETKPTLIWRHKGRS